MSSNSLKELDVSSLFIPFPTNRQATVMQNKTIPQNSNPQNFFHQHKTFILFNNQNQQLELFSWKTIVF